MNATDPTATAAATPSVQLPAVWQAGMEVSTGSVLAVLSLSIYLLSSTSCRSVAGVLRGHFGHGRPLAIQLAVGLLGRLHDGVEWSTGRAVEWAALGCLATLVHKVARAETAFFRSDTSFVVASQSVAQELSRVAVHKADQHFTYFFSGGYSNSILMSCPDSGWAQQKRLAG